MREIPWWHIDALSYGPVDYYMNEFDNWLHAASRNGVSIVILPSPKDVKSWFTVSMASTTIRESAKKVGLTVMTESRLRKKGILKDASLVAKKEQPSRLPNAFEQLVITQLGVLEFVPHKS